MLHLLRETYGSFSNSMACNPIHYNYKRDIILAVPIGVR